jgi:hypothetical protein
VHCAVCTIWAGPDDTYGSEVSKGITHSIDDSVFGIAAIEGAVEAAIIATLFSVLLDTVPDSVDHPTASCWLQGRGRRRIRLRDRAFDSLILNAITRYSGPTQVALVIGTSLTVRPSIADGAGESNRRIVSDGSALVEW